MTEEPRKRTAEPITLEDACAMYPRASFKISTLRSAAAKGHLDIFLLGRRYHTTPAAMDEWVRRCQENARRPASTSIESEDNG
jgi:hypothetical protein